ncbi:MAG: DUF4124 domain-containing protein [Comamonadaceae bacterium]|nr:MAG: DUF4124 domain-containing protein [Comamonadaceae bacterium]
MAAAVTGLVASLLPVAVGAQSIFTCVDAKGRKLTSDRPIYECADRTQQEMTTTGTVKRVIGPTLTARERSAQDDKDRQAAEIRARETEEKRRDRALLLRYPNKASHDKERAIALAQVDEVIKAAAKRTGELADQRKAIDLDLEFYVKDPSRAPASLKRRLEENDSSVALQKKFIADQDIEKQRVNQRFDEELVKLRQLWTLTAVPGAPASVASTPQARR